MLNTSSAAAIAVARNLIVFAWLLSQCVGCRRKNGQDYRSLCLPELKSFRIDYSEENYICRYLLFCTLFSDLQAILKRPFCILSCWTAFNTYKMFVRCRGRDLSTHVRTLRAHRFVLLNAHVVTIDRYNYWIVCTQAFTWKSRIDLVISDINLHSVGFCCRCHCCIQVHCSMIRCECTQCNYCCNKFLISMKRCSHPFSWQSLLIKFVRIRNSIARHNAEWSIIIPHKTFAIGLSFRCFVFVCLHIIHDDDFKSIFHSFSRCGSRTQWRLLFPSGNYSPPLCSSLLLLLSHFDVDVALDVSATVNKCFFFYKLLRCSGVNSKLSGGTKKQLNYVCGVLLHCHRSTFARAPLEFPI